MGNKFLDITDQRFGKLVAISYIGNKLWNCKCDCGEYTTATGTQLRKQMKKSCGCEVGNREKLEGKRFGDITVIEWCKDGKKQYLCRCDCGNILKVFAQSLKNGNNIQCDKCEEKSKLDKTVIEYNSINHTGETFGELVLIKRITEMQYECRCSCGNTCIKYYNQLKSGRSKSCGHTKNTLRNIINTKIGKLTVDCLVGADLYKCICDCGKERIVRGYYLRRKYIKDCGCTATDKRKKTLFDTYGEIVTNKMSSIRTPEQIQYVQNKEALLKCIDNNFKDKQAFIHELCDILGLTKSMVLKYIHKYNLEYKVKHGGSKSETEIFNYISSIYDGNIIRHDRTQLDNLEIDIYIPDKRLGIEFNGDYWHSSTCKNKKYHQDKTIQAAKKGIRLIHIFEYEWNNSETKIKLENLLKTIFTAERRIYARKCKVVTLSNEEAMLFEDNNHLQCRCVADRRYGLLINEEIVAVMSFSRPRFDTEADWEIIRYCTKLNIVGGFAKLMTHFIREVNPSKVISYCDISKFTGNVYNNNGFTTSINNISEPNYKWVLKYADRNSEGTKVLNRYATQKSKLLADGLGIYGDTEDEIMHNIGYIKIYDCGNLKFTWENK